MLIYCRQYLTHEYMEEKGHVIYTQMCDDIVYVHFNVTSLPEIIYWTVRSAGSMHYTLTDYVVGGMWFQNTVHVCSPLVLFLFVFISTLLHLSPHRCYWPSISKIVKGNQKAGCALCHPHAHSTFLRMQGKLKSDHPLKSLFHGPASSQKLHVISLILGSHGSGEVRRSRCQTHRLRIVKLRNNQTT